MKTMKTIILTLLVLFSVKLNAQTISMSHVVVPLSEPGKPYSISVELIAAHIKLTTYAGKEVVIDVLAAEPQKEPSSDNSGPRLTLSNGTSDKISAHEKNNAVTVTKSTSSRETINLNIKIPAGATHIKLSLNDGTVNASMISGDIEVNNTHGNINLDNVSGSVVANTNDGNLKVVFKSVNVNAAMAFSSLRGTIYVTLPATFKANVKLRSDRGYLFSDFDIATDNPENKGVKTPDGRYRWRTGDWVNGKIAGGGQELMMKNYRGDIYLQKAK